MYGHRRGRRGSVRGAWERHEAMIWQESVLSTTESVLCCVTVDRCGSGKQATGQRVKDTAIFPGTLTGEERHGSFSAGNLSLEQPTILRLHPPCAHVSSSAGNLSSRQPSFLRLHLPCAPSEGNVKLNTRCLSHYRAPLLQTLLARTDKMERGPPMRLLVEAYKATSLMYQVWCTPFGPSLSEPIRSLEELRVVRRDGPYQFGILHRDAHDSST